MKAWHVLLVIFVCFLVGAGAGGAYWVMRYALPHMNEVAHLRPYEVTLPAMPAHTVPVTGTAEPPSAAVAATMPNPYPPTPENMNLGRIYYGYYCQHCHGSDGRGNVPVGESYHPVPTDLTTTAIQSQSDGTLAWMMTQGIGHAPVLQGLVPPARRWLIVHHLRTLPQAPPQPYNPNPVVPERL